MRVSEIRVKRIRVNQGLGVCDKYISSVFQTFTSSLLTKYLHRHLQDENFRQAK